MAVASKGIVSKVKLSDAEKLAAKMGKTFASMLETSDAATVARAIATLNGWHNVLTQTGEGEGKRFRGAASHDYGENAAAFVEIVRRGNIPTAG